MNRFRLDITSALLVGCLTMAFCIPDSPLLAATIRESEGEKEARMQWWREARFGMFIHWGLYAIPAGEWNGKPVGGGGEWILNGANIPVAEYEKLAPQFNPVSFDAAEWVRLAKQAGMKYIVITSKHHDGFCLFDTTATDWDVVSGTPYAKDLLKPLADECKKQGVKFCVYYSIMDWHHASQAKHEKGYNPTTIRAGKKGEYIDYMKHQLKELVDQYAPHVIWFDGEWPSWWEEENGQEIYDFLLSLDTKLIVNNRVGKGRSGMAGFNKKDRTYVGDFGTPEQEIPATGVPGVDWESCMTMNDTWGYKQQDRNWKSAKTLIRNLVDITSKGGNYLLNIGPTEKGLFPQASIDRLEQIGSWMKVNGESIYNTTSSPFKKLAWGRCTKRSHGGKVTLYLHVFDWPKEGKLLVPGLQNKIASAKILSTGASLQAELTKEGVALQLPMKSPDTIDTVLVLELIGALSVQK